MALDAQAKGAIILWLVVIPITIVAAIAAGTALGIGVVYLMTKVAG